MRTLYRLATVIGLATLASSAWAQNLVKKPDFGTTASPATGSTTTGAADFTTDLNPGAISNTNAVYAITSAYNGVVDHTQGGAPGVYLGINGPTTAAKSKVWEQTLTVQPNQAYTFSYWQVNLATTNIPKVQFEYVGNITTSTTVVNSYSATGTAWTLVSYTINSGTNTQLTLRLRDLVVATTGNNFGLDDISFYLQSAGAITGTVFEDLNYGGGVGRALSATTSSTSTSATAIARPLATVELYSNTGVLASTTTTNSAGGYTFPGLAAGTYTVRVVSSTVTSSRTGGTTGTGLGTAGLVPVVTFQNGTTDQVGGPNPALPDAPANTSSTPAPLSTLTTATQAVEALSSVTVTGTNTTTGVDFGFNFDTVVNTKDSGQGSLRQFIANSNALGGESTLAQAGFYRNQIVGANPTIVALPTNAESSIFMIPSGTAAAGLRAASAGGPASQLSADGVAVITPSTALPAISGPSTAINGWTQTYNLGNTNDKTLGSNDGVGTTGTLLTQLNGPEVQLTGSTAVAIGLDVAAGGTGTSLLGLAIYGFGNALDSDANANIRSAAASLSIAQNVIGSAATAFAAPTTLTNADNIRLTGGTGIVVSNNLVGFANGKGLAVAAASTGATISGNQVNTNGQGNAALDGLNLQGSSASITNNLFAGNAGQGIDSYRSAGSNTITGNTISGNGRGTSALATSETPGVRIYGASNTLRQNVVSGNYGSGIYLEGTTNNGNVAAASTTLISQNSIFDNGNVRSLRNDAASGAIGIDLGANGNNEATGTSPYVTLNSTTTTGANGLLNYPILQLVRLNGSYLVVSGLATAGATIELFTAQANPASANATGANFGQGSLYLGSAVVPSSGITASYGPTTNGFAQGSGTNINYFVVSISLGSLSNAQRSALVTGTLLTSTATVGSTTSEFSGNLALTAGPSAFNTTNLNVGASASPSPAILNPNLTVPQAASDPASTIASFTVYPVQSGGTLRYNGTAIPAAGQVVTVDNVGLLTFEPTANTTGNALFVFTATNTAGVVSNQAVYTIPVVSSPNGFVTNDDGLDTPQNTTTAGNAVLNDTNANTTTNFTATKVADPTHGTVTLNADGSYSYVPTTGYLGPDSFQYQICTGSGSTAACSNTSTVSINVYNPALVCNSATGPNLLLNPGFELGNQNFTSAYKFVARPATNVTASPDGLYPEGNYAVDADANYYHKDFVGVGHNGSGKFMIVNGAANQSQVYAQVVNVVPNRYYSFSGYAQSVNASSPAILGFVINGKSASVSTQLPSSTNTAGTYVQFSGVWYSGTSRTATFEVRDINREKLGNDFGLDDLYFGTCNVNLTVSDVNNPKVSSQSTATNLDPMQATFTGTGITIASLMVSKLPATGQLRLGGVNGTVVKVGDLIPYDQRSTLYYAPVANSAGTVAFEYSAVDSEGAGSNNKATFSIPVVAAPLPVSLTSFTAQAAGTAAQLEWVTASEVHNDYFAVERSTTGQAADFVALGQVAGHGSSAAPHAYRFLDRGAAAAGALAYYRLRQVDFDGTSRYSAVQVVSFEASHSSRLGLYPNPTAGASTLDLSSLPATTTYQVRLVDATGRTVRQWQLLGGQAHQLDVASLAAGTYLLLVSGTPPGGTPLRQVLHLTKD